MDKIDKVINEKTKKIEKLKSAIEELKKEEDELKTLKSANKILNKTDSLKNDINITGNNNFQKTSYSKATQEALLEMGDPTRLNDLYKIISDKYDHLNSIASLNSALSRLVKQKNIFTRTEIGVYGLIDWELEEASFQPDEESSRLSHDYNRFRK